MRFVWVEAVSSIALEMMTAVQDSTVTMENVLTDAAKIPIVQAVTLVSTMPVFTRNVVLIL